MGWHGPYKSRKFEVGEQLRAFRTRAKLTQAELAGLIGGSHRSVQSWEAGTAYPQGDKLQGLISVFLTKRVLTPGQDPFSQCLLAAPMILLYELGIFLVGRNKSLAHARVAD